MKRFFLSAMLAMLSVSAVTAQEQKEDAPELIMSAQTKSFSSFIQGLITYAKPIVPAEAMNQGIMASTMLMMSPTFNLMDPAKPMAVNIYLNGQSGEAAEDVPVIAVRSTPRAGINDKELKLGSLILNAYASASKDGTVVLAASKADAALAPAKIEAALPMSVTLYPALQKLTRESGSLFSSDFNAEKIEYSVDFTNGGSTLDGQCTIFFAAGSPFIPMFEKQIGIKNAPEMHILKDATVCGIFNGGLDDKESADIMERLRKENTDTSRLSLKIFEYFKLIDNGAGAISIKFEDGEVKTILGEVKCKAGKADEFAKKLMKDIGGENVKEVEKGVYTDDDNNGFLFVNGDMVSMLISEGIKLDAAKKMLADSIKKASGNGNCYEIWLSDSATNKLVKIANGQVVRQKGLPVVICKCSIPNALIAPYLKPLIEKQLMGAAAPRGASTVTIDDDDDDEDDEDEIIVPGAKKTAPAKK